MKLQYISVDLFAADPSNPRTQCNAAKDAELANSIRDQGVQVPLIGYVQGDRIVIEDGHRRWTAARAAGIPDLPVIVLPEKPDAAQLLVAQLTINGQRAGLNPVDEYDAFAKLAAMKKWSPSQLATALAVSNAEVTRILSIGKLNDEERRLVREERISKSSAYALSRMPPEQRQALVEKAAAGQVTRDQLNRKARRKPATEGLTTRRISCQLTSGTVSINAPGGVSLAGVIDLLDELIRQCRKARSQGLDVATMVRILQDRARGCQSIE